ncbi:hypothetical protein HV824_33465 [Myxococcus sp. AM009]|uniref:hypothetical protein n=1 Tax=unclassified Myxococcus TaxID=2648731 RepID=UPI00159503EE|nr:MULTISPECIES: hypothetical protein [unclassified Myxococcus]NVJ02996.1 hypothetical protein [Myxococcus sp. AM009]NVJ19401.1 hypothetical protein [Myxococcus sp. AM010]
MKLKTLVGAVVMVVMMTGCGPMEEAPVDEGAQLSTLSTEELEKLQSSIPVPDAQMLQALQTACGTTPEGACVAAGYGACTGWSAVVDCGAISACDPDDIACKQRICNPERPSDCEWYTTGTQYQARNQYRVCSNPVGDTCTEYIRTSRRVCGCGGNGIPF